MDISLEKIELVKDRTGVGYREAKEALEHCNGNVVDAIVYIEDTIDDSVKVRNTQVSDVAGKIRDLIRAGNVSKVLVRKDEDVILKIPVNIGIVGTIVFPWAALLGVIAAFGTKCTIEIVKQDGEVVDISSKAGELYNTAKAKGSVIVDEVKDKGGEVFQAAAEKGKQAFNAAVEKASGAAKNVQNDGPSAFDDLDLSDIDLDDEDDK